MIETRTASGLARSMVCLTEVILLAALVLVLSFDTPLSEETFGFRGWGPILSGAFAAAGLLVATRVPSNPIRGSEPVGAGQ